MNIRINFIVGVALQVIRFASTRAQEHASLTIQNPDDNSSQNTDSVETADQIVFDISKRRFNDAFKKAQGLNDITGTFNYVIRKVYNNDQHNAELILEFLDSNPDEVKTSLAAYDALNYEMNQKKHNDYLLRLVVMKSFNSKPFDLEKREVKEIKDKLRNKVKGILVDNLKSAILSKSSKKIKTICDNVYDNYPELFNDVIEGILNESFDEIDKHYLINFFLSHNHPEQSMSVYLATYEKSKMNKSDLNQHLVVLLASGVKEAADKSDVQTWMKGFNLRDQLTLSVKNIAFTSPVYIVNKNGDYLYAASDGFNHDEKRRTVFAWTAGNLGPSQSMWFIERLGEVYQIKNHRNDSHSEYMFRSVIRNTRIRTNVLTWIPGGTDHYRPNQFNWTFEPSGDYVYIRNELKKEYLHVTDEYEGLDRRDRRYVQLDKEKSDRGLWKIMDLLRG